jgi:hypothetical protein
LIIIFDQASDIDWRYSIIGRRAPSIQVGIVWCVDSSPIVIQVLMMFQTPLNDRTNYSQELTALANTILKWNTMVGSQIKQMEANDMGNNGDDNRFGVNISESDRFQKTKS